MLVCDTAVLVTFLQTEDFYNFADENGLLIWQDAMFGGSHYPRTAEWLNNYAEEISQQVSVCASALNPVSICMF
jgi:beta-galactosidase/beta-glucuronidase